MSKKNVRELAKKLDEEAYYKDLLEKSKRNSKLGKQIGHALVAFAFHLFHITRLHFFNYEREVEIDGINYRLEKCIVCGAERVKDRQGDWDYREVLKAVLGFILTGGGFLFTLAVEDNNLLPSPLVTFNAFLGIMLLVIFCIHVMRCLIQIIKD